MSNSLIQIFLPVSLAFTMFGMGASLTLDDFSRIVKFPKSVILGLAIQIILLPLIGFLLALTFNLNTTMAIGVMILVSAPGGVTSNMVTQICKGNIALSVTLTAITSFTILFTTQAILAFSLAYFKTNNGTLPEFSFTATSLQIILITIAPVLLGMLFKYLAPSRSKKIEKPMRTVSTVLFLIIFIGIIATNFNLIGNAIKQVGWVMLLLNLSMLSIGFFSAKLLCIDSKSAITIAIEGSVQNATLALVIATSLLKNNELGLPTAAYVIWMYITSGILMWYVNKKNKF